MGQPSGLDLFRALLGNSDSNLLIVRACEL